MFLLNIDIQGIDSRETQSCETCQNVWFENEDHTFWLNKENCDKIMGYGVQVQQQLIARSRLEPYGGDGHFTTSLESCKVNLNSFTFSATTGWGIYGFTNAVECCSHSHTRNDKDRAYRFSEQVTTYNIVAITTTKKEGNLSSFFF